MEISLNRANKIRNTLEGMAFMPSLVVSMRTDEDLSTIFQEKLEEFQKSFDRMCLVEEMISELRTLISKANHENGIHEIIGEIAGHERLNKQLNVLKSNLLYEKHTIDDLIATVNFEKDAVAKERIPPVAPRKVSARLIDADFLEEKQKKVFQRLDQLKETRNALNHKVTIKLPEAMAEFLRMEGLA